MLMNTLAKIITRTTIEGTTCTSVVCLRRGMRDSAIGNTRPQGWECVIHVLEKRWLHCYAQ